MKVVFSTLFVTIFDIVCINLTKAKYNLELKNMFLLHRFEYFFALDQSFSIGLQSTVRIKY